MMLKDDVDRIMEVMDAAFDPFWGEAWNRMQIEGALAVGNTHYWLIAPDGAHPKEGEEAAGFALVRQVFDEAELLLFAIAPRWRRRGLGATLLSRTIADMKRSGVIKVMLEMRRGNPAEYLYRAAGFAPIGVRPKYYRCSDGNRIDAVTFSFLPDEQNN
jgi:ribosomal-protein-alanine N-acetyltransferase